MTTLEFGNYVHVSLLSLPTNPTGLQRYILVCAHDFTVDSINSESPWSSTLNHGIQVSWIAIIVDCLWMRLGELLYVTLFP